MLTEIFQKLPQELQLKIYKIIRMDALYKVHRQIVYHRKRKYYFAYKSGIQSFLVPKELPFDNWIYNLHVHDVPPLTELGHGAAYEFDSERFEFLW
jgi:hypothetical protein